MSSRSELIWRGGAAGLFALLMLASAFAYHGITPVFGAPSSPPARVRAVDGATAWLNRATRPFEDAAFCEPVRAYAPSLMRAAESATPMREGPSPALIVCDQAAEDFPAALSRAMRGGLTWVRRVDGTSLIIFARNEADARGVFGKAGMPPSALRAFQPTAPALLHALRSSASGVVDDGGVWRAPAHPRELVLYGPYLDLAPGDYRVRLHVKVQGSPAECRAALASLSPTMAVTADTGRAGVRASQPMTVQAGGPDACAATLSDRFTVAPGGAKQVETPFSAAASRPYVIDDYALEPAAPAAAQSR